MKTVLEYNSPSRKVRMRSMEPMKYILPEKLLEVRSSRCSNHTSALSRQSLQGMIEPKVLRPPKMMHRSIAVAGLHSYLCINERNKA